MKKTAFLLLIVFLIGCTPAFADMGIEVDMMPEEFDCTVLKGAEEPVEYEITEPFEVESNFSLMDEEINFASYEDYYGYSLMCSKGSRFESAYKIIAQGMKNRTKQINVKGLFTNFEELKMVFYAVLYDDASLYYVKSGFGCAPDFSIIAPMYIEEEFNDDLFLKLAEELLKKSGARKSMSDFDKALLIHDALIDHITYKEEYKTSTNMSALDEIFPYVHTAYGAIVDGSAVCDGYAKAYQYLLSKMGIVSHITPGVGHAWNLVKLDGEWYYSDVTWNDADIKATSLTTPLSYYYNNLNMTTEKCIQTGHEFDLPYEFPSCSATKNDYYVKNNMVFEQIDIDTMAKQLEKNQIVKLYVSGNMDDAVKWVIDNASSIAEKAGLSPLGIGCTRTKNELFIRYVFEKIGIDKNMLLTIGSSVDKNATVFLAYYDENDKLIDSGFEKNVELKKDENIYIKITGEKTLSDYKYVKAYLWDEANGFSPVYDCVKLEY